MGSLLSSAQNSLNSRLGRNVGVVLFGQLGKAALQGAYFVIIARALGVSDFGSFAAIIALTALVTPFASLGAMNLLVRSIVQDSGSIAVNYATARRATLIGGVVAGALISLGSSTIAPPGIAVSTVALIVAADIIFARLIDLAGAAFAAKEQMGRTASFQLLLNSSRLLAAGLLWSTASSFELSDWALWYFVSSALPCVGITILAVRMTGRGKPNLTRFLSEIRDGTLFAISLSSQTVYNDVDKVMLARLSTLESTGIYTAAYRVVDIAYTPMRAIMGAAYPRFFRHGKDGLGPAVRFARKIAAPGVGYCVFASLMLFACADAVPIFLGNEYESAVSAVRALAVLPVLKAVHYLAADALTGANLQGTRSVVQVGVAAANVFLNLWLIPSYGYWGAVYSSLVSDGLLALGLWFIVWRKIRNAPAPDETPHEAL